VDGSTKFDTAGQFITFSIAYTAPCVSFTPMVGVVGGTFSGATYTLGQAASTQTFTDLESTTSVCVTGYTMANQSPAIVTLPTSTSRTISFSSTDTSLYKTSGTVTGNIYALKADGSTTYSTAGQFITFSIAYTAPCVSFNPMVGSTAGTWTGTTYTLGQTAESQTFTDLEPTSNICVSGYELADVSNSMVTMPSATTRSV